MRQDLLLTELRRSDVPLSANTLSSLLGISPRTVRDYVAKLNEGMDRPLVISDQLGYRLDQYVYHKVRSAKIIAMPSEYPDMPPNHTDTPRARLNSILRYLSTDGEIDVHELAEHLHVSDATIEADLQRVRAVVRDQQLVLRRRKSLVFLEGTDRAKRRLLRSVLFSADDGTAIDALMHTRDRPDSEVARLSKELTAALAGSGLELNEYVRGELLIHLTVAVERSRKGSPVDPQPVPDGADPAISGAVRAIVGAVERVTGTMLDKGEQELLYTLLLANSRPLEKNDRIQPDPDILDLTYDALNAISEQFGVRRNDDRHLIPLALHLQHLRERAFLDRQLDSPMGPGFRREHPLLHEMALLFAHALQVRTGLEIGSGEIVYLALHLGAQFQSQLENGPLVTVSLVAPEHGTLTDLLAEKVRKAIGPQGRLESVVTDVSVDFQGLTSDVVVSTIPGGTPTTQIPFVQISPFCTDLDATYIRDAVRREQERQRKYRVQSTVVSLIDPALFQHVERFSSAEEAIHMGADLLITHGLAEPGFAEDVLERERRSSTSFGGRFSIPHSLYQDGLRTGICVLTSRHPLAWAGSEVQLIFMFVIAPDGMPLFRDALEALVPVLSEPKNVAHLINASAQFSTFIEALLSLLS